MPCNVLVLSLSLALSLSGSYFAWASHTKSNEISFDLMGTQHTGSCRAPKSDIPCRVPRGQVGGETKCTAAEEGAAPLVLPTGPRFARKYP